MQNVPSTSTYGGDRYIFDLLKSIAQRKSGFAASIFNLDNLDGLRVHTRFPTYSSGGELVLVYNGRHKML